MLVLLYVHDNYRWLKMLWIMQMWQCSESEHLKHTIDLNQDASNILLHAI